MLYGKVGLISVGFLGFIGAGVVLGVGVVLGAGIGPGVGFAPGTGVVDFGVV